MVPDHGRTGRGDECSNGRLGDTLDLVMVEIPEEGYVQYQDPETNLRRKVLARTE